MTYLLDSIIVGTVKEIEGRFMYSSNLMRSMRSCSVSRAACRHSSSKHGCWLDARYFHTF